MRVGGELKTPARESGERCGSAGRNPFTPVAISFHETSQFRNTCAGTVDWGQFQSYTVLWYELLMVCPDPTLTSEYKIDSKLSLLIHSRVYGMQMCVCMFWYVCIYVYIVWSFYLPYSRCSLRLCVVYIAFDSWRCGLEGPTPCTVPWTGHAHIL